MAFPGNKCCPVCQAALWAPNTEPVGWRTCPRCQADLWVLAGAGGPMFFPRRPGQSETNFLAALAAPLYGMSAEEVEAGLQSADSLDLVEVVMEIEEAIRSQ